MKTGRFDRLDRCGSGCYDSEQSCCCIHKSWTRPHGGDRSEGRSKRNARDGSREREKSGNWKRRSSAHMASAVLLASRCSSSDRCGGRRPEGGDPASEECGRRTPPKQSKAKQLFLRFVTVKRSEGLKAKSAERQISRAWRVGYCV